MILALFLLLYTTVGRCKHNSVSHASCGVPLESTEIFKLYIKKFVPVNVYINVYVCDYKLTLNWTEGLYPFNGDTIPTSFKTINMGSNKKPKHMEVLMANPTFP